MTTVVPLSDGGFRIYTKGASEVVSKKLASPTLPKLIKISLTR